MVRSTSFVPTPSAHRTNNSRRDPAPANQRAYMDTRPSPSRSHGTQAGQGTARCMYRTKIKLAPHCVDSYLHAGSSPATRTGRPHPLHQRLIFTDPSDARRPPSSQRSASSPSNLHLYTSNINTKLYDYIVPKKKKFYVEHIYEKHAPSTRQAGVESVQFFIHFFDTTRHDTRRHEGRLQAMHHR